MGKVLIEPSGDVAVVRLNNGPTNAVNLELVDALSAAIQTVSKEFNGMVLAGGEKFFCIGLSLPELLKLNRGDMTDFWFAFNRSTLALYTLPLPTVCAIAGHAPAVGTIWACACDFRFAAQGRGHRAQRDPVGHSHAFYHRLDAAANRGRSDGQ